MTVLLLSIFFSVLVCGLVVAVLMWVRTPYYQVRTEFVIRLFEWVLLGQATANDWRVFCEMPIRHDDFLESIRLQCLALDEECYTGTARPPYLLSPAGLELLQELLQQLRDFQSDHQK